MAVPVHAHHFGHAAPGVAWYKLAVLLASVPNTLEQRLWHMDDKSDVHIAIVAAKKYRA